MTYPQPWKRLPTPGPPRRIDARHSKTIVVVRPSSRRFWITIILASLTALVTGFVSSAILYR